MNKINKLYTNALAIPLLLFLLTACPRPIPSPWIKVLSGTHDLMKFKYQSHSSSRLHGSGGFLFFVGGVTLDGETKTEMRVYMSWYDKVTDTYIVSNFPMNQVRFRLKKVSTPYVEFKHKHIHSTYDFDDDLHDVLSLNLLYVVVTISPTQYKRDIRTNW